MYQATVVSPRSPKLEGLVLDAVKARHPNQHFLHVYEPERHRTQRASLNSAYYPVDRLQKTCARGHGQSVSHNLLSTITYSTRLSQSSIQEQTIVHVVTRLERTRCSSSRS